MPNTRIWLFAGDRELPIEAVEWVGAAAPPLDAGSIAELEAAGVAWARRILSHAPLAIRCLKPAFNAELDGQAGIQELAGHATQLFYMTEEAQEGRDAYNEKRPPDFSRFPWRP